MGEIKPVGTDNPVGAAKSSSSISRRLTEKPDYNATWAKPLPISPAPKNRNLWIFMVGLAALT
jgi:hypothetical protein